MGIVRFALRWPYTFYVLALLILFLGFSAFRSMPTDIFPEIDIPVVTVIWQYTGLSTPEMEQRVTTYSDVMQIRLYVPQDAAIGVKPGVDAVVRVPEIPGRPFTGKVTRIADALDPATRTLMSEIDVPNSDGALSPGLYCTVELRVPRRTPSLIVPAAAIVFDRDGLHVLAVENGVVSNRKITEIRDLGTEVEISEGVKEGDQVVLNPPIDLEDGSKVQVRVTPAATPAS